MWDRKCTSFLTGTTVPSGHRVKATRGHYAERCQAIVPRMRGSRRESSVLVRLGGELVAAATGDTASVATRFRARLADISIGTPAAAALAGALILVFQFFGAGHDFGMGPNNLDYGGSQWQNFTLILLVVSILVIALIEAFFVSAGRPTPGKRDRHLLVVSVVDRRPPDLVDCIIRSLIPVGAWSVGPALVAAAGISWPLLAGPAIGACLYVLVHVPAVAHSTRRGLHDMAARTIVVEYRLLEETN